jgi:hypothetical protein
MQKFLTTFLFSLALYMAKAQELYVSTEPASNMAAGSVGLRMNTRLFQMKYDSRVSYRLNPELMLGISKKLMLHINGFASDVYQQHLKMEGGTIYGKYRFLSVDDVQTHFRMAAFGKIALIDNPSGLQLGNKYIAGDDIDLDGNNSGWQGGIVATQLLHKLALSTSVSFAARWDNLHTAKFPGQSRQALNYTFSAGYLLFPVTYKDFRQTNVNLYCEWLGSASLDKKAGYIDIAPAIQFIFNSISRLDFSYRTQLAGGMQRLTDSEFLVRLEYNFLNVFKNR